jgi:protein-S-isoprenylcysteine O-methyltransferase Ste14
MPTNSDQSREPIDRRRLILGIGWGLLGYLLCLFIPAGTLAWSRGWLFFLVLVGTMIPVVLYLQRVNPEVVAARINRRDGTKRWDRILMCIFYPLVMLVVILAALDDGRFHWLLVPWWVCVLGYGILIAGMAGLTWAESVNKFFERTVRIQTERGHKVIDTGPYSIVRHPGYVSGCLFVVGMALALGSVWALIPAVLSCVVLVVRTVLEDKTLRAELVGYEEYTQRIPFKLLPGVW